jgi:hypothetical protein
VVVMEGMPLVPLVVGELVPGGESGLLVDYRCDTEVQVHMVQVQVPS